LAVAYFFGPHCILVTCRQADKSSEAGATWC